MFPIIPQYLASKANAEFVIDYSNTTSVREHHGPSISSSRDTDAIVSSVIEKNLESEDIEIGEILSSKSTKNSIEKIQIFSCNDKILCNTNCWSWLKQTHLAEDCHSYNIELIMSSSTNHLRIRATRRILPEERLILWFSTDLVATLQIPYLTLNNIRGERQYICHKCKFQCERPNPLKIHLSLECGKFSRKDLWNRLRQTTDSSTINVIDPINSIIPSRVVLATEKSHSAFKPYTKSSASEGRPNTSKMLLCPLSPDALLTEQKVPDFNQSMLYKQAVEMEAIVSHMGRIKQGHLCIYCGKIYSRKYGLKIHIRTHTGFKPLKCKFCLRPFGDPSNLNKHVRLHSEGDTPYKCELCSKILVRKRDLDRHMKSRH